MQFAETTALRKIARLNKKIRIIQGGTSASKTISILLYLIARAQSDTEPTLTSIISESVPHLKRGVIRDFKNIMEAHHYWKENNWNATDSIYSFETGSKIEFFSADQPDKLRGARRDRCFINEANNVHLDAFDQLEVRTKEFIFIDFNPTNEFWAFTDVIGKRTDVDHIILTYKDNEACPQEIVTSIEMRKNRPGWWKVYGEGQLGEVEGRIYTGWRTIDEIPHEARLERRWLDFGYTNDQSAIGEVWYYNGGWVLNENLYRKGMSNKQLADFLNSLPKAQTTVVADSAEPKSIDELRSFGLNVIPCEKGKDSVIHGIQLVQDQPISVTRNSFNILKEYRNYLFLVDKNGKILNEEDPACDNHHMAGIRYALSTLGKLKQVEDYWDRIFHKELNPKQYYKNPAI
jgi:phage terminase large subunit